jgi:hypothetical protein
MDRIRRTVLGALAAAGSTAGCLGSVGGSGAEGLPTLVLFDRGASTPVVAVTGRHTTYNWV